MFQTQDQRAAEPPTAQQATSPAREPRSHEDSLATIDELAEMASLFEERTSLRSGVSPCDGLSVEHTSTVSTLSCLVRAKTSELRGRFMPNAHLLQLLRTALRRQSSLCLVTQQHVKMRWQQRMLCQGYHGTLASWVLENCLRCFFTAGASLHNTSQPVMHKGVSFWRTLLCISTHLTAHAIALCPGCSTFSL
jgi:hypothetical protein